MNAGYIVTDLVKDLIRQKIKQKPTDGDDAQSIRKAVLCP